MKSQVKTPKAQTPNAIAAEMKQQMIDGISKFKGAQKSYSSKRPVRKVVARYAK